MSRLVDIFVAAGNPEINSDELVETILQLNIAPSMPKEEIKILMNITNLLQEDTRGELFSMILNLFSSHTLKNEIVNSLNELLTKLNQNNPKLTVSVILVFIITGLFNRADELLEDELQEGKPFNFNNFKSTASVSYHVEVNNKIEPVSFETYFTLLVKFIKLLPTDFHYIIDILNSLIKNNLKAIAIVSNIKSGIPYTSNDAIEYRKNTLGIYYKLLSELMADDGLQSNFSGGQLDDDTKDLVEDFRSQPNPFIGLLLEMKVLKLDISDEFANEILSRFTKLIRNYYSENDNLKRQAEIDLEKELSIRKKEFLDALENIVQTYLNP